MLQFWAAQTVIRDDFNPTTCAGKLSQQWSVNSYLQVEANNLNYIRQNQQQLRPEQYQGLAEHFADINRNAMIAAGVAVILLRVSRNPKKHEGAMLSCNINLLKVGAPDLFITFTANPICRKLSRT